MARGRSCKVFQTHNFQGCLIKGIIPSKRIHTLNCFTFSHIATEDFNWFVLVFYVLDLFEMAKKCEVEGKLFFKNVQDFS